MRIRPSFRFLVLLAAPFAAGTAQYVEDFEQLTATAGGTPLSQQGGYYLPPVPGSTDFQVFSYAGNAAGIPAHPNGGQKLIAGIAALANSSPRAQCNFAWTPAPWICGFDVCVRPIAATAAPPTIASWAIQPLTAHSFVATARWMSPASPTAWKADYSCADATGATIAVSVPDPAFQNLLLDHWYRWETVIDPAANRIAEVRITDLSTLVSTAWRPSAWYLAGGAAGSPPGTSFRFFVGGAGGGQVAAFDNVDIRPASPSFQTNSADAGLRLDAANGTAHFPAITTKTSGAGVTADFLSAQLGMPFEMVLASGPVLPASAGAAVTTGGQLVNVPVFTGLVTWLNGGTLPDFQPFPGTVQVPFQAPGGPAMLSAQMLVAAPAHADGFALSQPAELDIVPGGVLAGPTGDDSALLVVLQSGPLGGPAMLPFYGTSYTSLQVISNGRVMFGAPSTSFAANPAALVIDAPSVNVWVDLDPSTAGTIGITTPDSVTLRVDWNGVASVGWTGVNTFHMLLRSDGTVTLGGLGGVAATGAPIVIGLGPGPAGTDPGPRVFATGGPIAGPTGAAALYQAGVTGTVAAGLSSLGFAPNTTSGYDWTGL